MISITNKKSHTLLKENSQTQKHRTLPYLFNKNRRAFDSLQFLHDECLAVVDDEVSFEFAFTF